MEAVLTGESAPVPKSTDAAPLDALLGDRPGVVFGGTMVTMGQATAVVTATGDATELGKISALVTSVEAASTPLLDDLEVFGRWLAALTVLVAVGTFLIAYLVRGLDLGDAFGIGVGVAVAIIPEGLPAVTTVTLALGVQHMAR